MNRRNATIFDERTKQTYTIGELLGRGSFSTCHDLTDQENNKFAVKIISRKKLVHKSIIKQLNEEIAIHKSLDHENVVRFVKSINDFKNVYIILEKCLRVTLLGLKNRREKITEPEVRYFVKPIIKVCEYLHARKIIHRDLKLENILLSENMVVKVGDFGLSCQLKSDTDKAHEMCGTPNYIAPEIIRKEPYSFEVDAWSLGVIIYILLTGWYPFQTISLEDTLEKIKNCQYLIPVDVSQLASDVIRSLINKEIKNRPSMTDLLKSRFFKEYTPRALPISVLSDAPRFDRISDPILAESLVNEEIAKRCANSQKRPNETELNKNHYSENLQRQIRNTINGVKILPTSENVADWTAKIEDPEMGPIFWIGKWVDFSTRYGFGYQLNDNSTGIIFNNKSRIILTANNQNIQFISINGTETLHTIDKYSPALEKNIKLLDNFHKYMNEFLLKTGNDRRSLDVDTFVRLPYLQSWLRVDKDVIMQLNNGTTQINFASDHSKLILCPTMGAVTHIDKRKRFNTYTFAKLKTHGISKELHSLLGQSLEMIEKLVVRAK